MKHSRICELSGLCLVASLHFTAASLFADNWMTAPQLCRGKAYSESARAAQWKFDREQRVALATKESPTIYASVFPDDHSDFVVNVRVRLDDGARCRLSLDKTTFDLANSGSQTQLVVDGNRRSVENTNPDGGSWTLLTIRRRNDAMAASINGQHAVDLESNSRAINKIGLRSLRGTIAVRNFSLTGNLQRRNLE